MTIYHFYHEHGDLIVLLYDIYSILYVCVCYWPPVREVCPNYEVVTFQPQILTNLDLGSVADCYTAYLLNPPHHLFLPFNVRPGEAYKSCPNAPDINVSPNRIICPPGRHPSLSQHTNKRLPASPSPITSRFRFLLPTLATAMSNKFLSPLIPCCHRDLF